MAFNKQVTNNRFNEIRDIVVKTFSGLKLELNNNTWVGEWKKVSNDKWIELSKLPEFDKSVVEAIIGFTLDLTPKETIKIGQYTYDKIEVENKLRDLKPI